MDTILFLTMVLKFDDLTYTKMREISPYIQKRKKPDGHTYADINWMFVKEFMIRQLGDVERDISKYNKTSIKDNPILDLFGYIPHKPFVGSFSKESNVHFSRIEGIEPFPDDLICLNGYDFPEITDEEFVYVDKVLNNVKLNFGIHINLSKIGKCDSFEIDNKEKINRIKKLLDVISELHIKVRKNEEILTPIFIAADIYYEEEFGFVYNPIPIMEPIKIKDNKLDCEIFNKNAKYIGVNAKEFKNSIEIKRICKNSVSDAFNQIKQYIKQYYN